MLDWAKRFEYHYAYDEIMDVVGRFFRKCAAAGDICAVMKLARMYENGIYYEQDLSKALKLYETAAEAGECDAVVKLGLCYYFGKALSADDSKAYRLFDLAVQLNDDAIALYMIGDMYYCGRIVDKNLNYAAKIYYRALNRAGKGNPSVLPDIHFRLRRLLLDSSYSGFYPQKAMSHLCKALQAFCDSVNMAGALVRTDNDSMIRETQELIARAVELRDC